MTDSQKKFHEILKDDSFGIFPAPTDPQLALQVIADYVLGTDWYMIDPMSQEQVNTEIVCAILSKVSWKYRLDALKRAVRRALGKE